MSWAMTRTKAESDCEKIDIDKILPMEKVALDLTHLAFKGKYQLRSGEWRRSSAF